MTLPELRMKIDTMNRELVALLGQRTEIARKIARVKKEERLPILDFARENEIKEEMKELARAHGLSAPIVEELFDLLFSYTRLEMELEVV